MDNSNKKKALWTINDRKEWWQEYSAMVNHAYATGIGPDGGAQETNGEAGVFHSQSFGLGIGNMVSGSNSGMIWNTSMPIGSGTGPAGSWSFGASALGSGICGSFSFGSGMIGSAGIMGLGYGLHLL